MKKLLLLLATVGIIFTACEGGGFEEENGGTPSTPKIELSQQSVEVEFESAEYEVTITSPYSWEAAAKNDWIEVITETGIAGTKTLKFSVARNEEKEIREGTIVVKNEDYNLIAELYITQKAFVPEWIIEPESLNFTFEGGTQEIAITANFEYAYSANADWLTIKKSGSGIKVTAQNNVAVDERTAEITISNEKYGISKVVNVMQGASVPAITIEPESLTFTLEGGTQEIAITANFEYAYSANADWLTIEKSGSGIKVTAKANANFEERTAEITISSEKYGISKTIAVTQKGVSAESQNVIIYTSSDGKVVTPYKSNVFGANIVSNTYSNGQGVIIFDAPVTSIGDDAFYWCSSLTSITIGDSVTSIGNYAFSYCRSLTSVTIPDSVTSIGDDAFYDCTSLTSVTIGNSVTSIGDLAFLDCSSLTAFYGKFASADNRCLIIDGVLNSFAPAGLTEYTIPDSVTSIGDYAFYYCTSLTSVTIPDSVTSIGDYAFYYCTSLTSVTIPDSVTSIGDYAFYDCTSLTSVTIPDSVTSIGGSAFSCTSLVSVYCKAITPPRGGYNMFYNNASGRKIYVPRNSVSAYKAKLYWSSYASDIVGYDF